MAHTDGAERGRRRLHAALVAGLALAAGCHRPAADVEADPASVVAGLVGTCASVVREVQIRRAGQAAWEPAVVGSTLRPGDELRTGPLSTARLAFLAGAGLEIGESADVVVDAERDGRDAAPGAAPRPVVAVKEGVVHGVLLPAEGAGAPSAGLTVRSGDAGVRISSRAGAEETAFRLLGNEGGTELAVVRGAATVKGARGEIALAAGQVALVRGGELVEPAALIASPEALEPRADARLAFVPGLALRMRWAEVKGASGYRIQIARDATFEDVEVADAVGGTEYVFRPAKAGGHAWRVAAQDAAGRYGEYGPVSEFLCEEPAPGDPPAAPAGGVVASAPPSAPAPAPTPAARAAAVAAPKPAPRASTAPRPRPAAPAIEVPKAISQWGG